MAPPLGRQHPETLAERRELARPCGIGLQSAVQQDKWLAVADCLESRMHAVDVNVIAHAMSFL